MQKLSHKRMSHRYVLAKLKNDKVGEQLTIVPPLLGFFDPFF